MVLHLTGSDRIGKGGKEKSLHWWENLTIQWSQVRFPSGLCAWAISVHTIHFLTGGIVHRHGLNILMYADDIQIYITSKTSSATQGKASVQTIEACISALRTWMIQNQLKLNDEKTELLVIASPRLQSKLTVNSITIGESIIQPSTKARNLGVIFDYHMDMEVHVTALTRARYGQLRKISHSRRYLTT